MDLQFKTIKLCFYEHSEMKTILQQVREFNQSQSETILKQMDKIVKLESQNKELIELLDRTKTRLRDDRPNIALIEIHNYLLKTNKK
jgi:hypothetical protein